MDSDTEGNNRISTVGLLARSPEGHAAKGMPIKGNEDVWIEIQAHTFRNWINEHLTPLGLSVADLSTDLCDGTRLIALVEALQKRTLRKIRDPGNRHQMLENVTRALDAIASDGVKLVNIGNVDIVNGNLKLILGLIWSLIVRYQIGRSKFPPKKLMLAWLRSVLPGVDINNFTSDWNSGVKLSALVDYCRPGTFPNWKHMSPKDGERNCRVAMEIAKKELGVPIVLDPEYLASPHLDELSGMTYISYFMRENGPGYKSQMNWVRNQLPKHHISNFTTDWNSGELLCELVRSYGGPIPGHENLSQDADHWESNLSLGMRGGEKLGVSSLLRPKDMADPNVDHLGVMAYTSQFQWLPSRPPPGQRVSVSWESRAFRKGEPITFDVEINEQIKNSSTTTTHTSEITVEVKGPSSKVDSRIHTTSSGAKGSFTATEIGIHEVVVKYQGEPVQGSPLKCRVLPQYNEISRTSAQYQQQQHHQGLAPCAVGSLVEVLVNPQDNTSPQGAKLEYLEVVAIAPSGRSVSCSVNMVAEGFAATFKPDEYGEWKVVVLYKGKDIQGSPFPCFVYDPNGVVLDTLEGALPGLPFAFICDSRGTGGLGDVEIDVTHEGRSIPYNTEYIADGVKRILLPVLNAGKHRVHVYFNGREIKGSPFSLRVGSSRSSRSTRNKMKEGSPGKTRSFDKDEIFGLSKSIQSNNTTTTTSFTNLLNKTLHNNSLSSSQQQQNRTSSSAASLNKHDIFESNSNTAAAAAATSSLNREIHKSSKERILHSAQRASSFNNTTTTSSRFDSTDAVHPRVKYGSVGERRSLMPPPPSPPGGRRSGDLYSDKKRWGSSSLENIESVGLLRGFSENVREHHEKSVKQQQQQQESSVTRLNGSNYYGDILSDEDDFVVEGDGLGVVLINSLVTVEVSCFKGAGLENVVVEVSGPGGEVLPVRQVRRDGNTVEASYRGLVVGEHLVDVVVEEGRGRRRVVGGGPFRAVVFNPEGIVVGRVPGGVVGRPVEIEIDGRGAGPGHLAILVDGGRVTSQVKALGDHRFRAVFVPHEAGAHLVDMTFNGVAVVGSPWRVNVLEKPSQNDVSLLETSTTNQKSSSSSSSYHHQQHHHQMSSSTMETSHHNQPGSSSSNNAIMIRGDQVRHVRFGKNAIFEINAPGFSREAVDVSVLSKQNPNRKPISYRLLEEGPGQFLVEFTPSEVGTHSLEVILANSSNNNRRLSAVAKVYNSSLIRVLDVTPGVVGQTSQFKVDAKDAGEGQLEISINDGELPNQVRVLGGGCCLVSFTPEVAKSHSIDIKFNGETIPGCPINCQVADSRQVAVSLAGLELIPVHKVSRFHIGVDSSSSAELAVSVKSGVSGVDLPVKVSGSVRSGFTAEFTPVEVGAHSITVVHNGVPAAGTPFVAKSYDANRVYVSPVPRGALGRSIQFTVDASQAGEGNLEITIGAKGRNVPTQVHPQGGARFNVSFVPLEPIDHNVTVTFNKEGVPGSPFVATVSADPGQVVVTGPSLAATPVGKAAHFSLSNVHSALDDVEVAVEGPGTTAIPVQVLEKAKNTFGVGFIPRIPGEHRISVSLKGTPVPGSPFTCKVYDVRAIKVRDTERGVVGKPVTFLVETLNAGPGNLEVTVNGGHVPTSAQAQGSQIYAISFTPKDAKPHDIELRFNSEDIPGSPFTCNIIDASKVTVTGEGLEKTPINVPASFTISPDSLLGPPEIKIVSPTKKQLTPSIQPMPPNSFTVSYLPVEVGDHTIDISFSGVPIPSSPFLVKAYDASRVRVTEISPGLRSKPVYFSIDASGGGAGNLEIIVSVSGRNVPNYVQAEGNAKFRVNFRPQEAAPHTISVRFNGEPVPGSPFTCKITDTDKIVVSGSALKSAAANVPATISIDPQGAEVSTANVIVLSPSALHLPINLTGSLPEKITATFTPTEVGPHSISINLDNSPVAGSPFSCNVYNAGRVKISGLKDGIIGESMTFTVDASAAGEGTLELVVTTGKASLRAEVTARSRGLYDVTFVPQEATLHFINITFNEVDVPGSPFECSVEQQGYEIINAGVRGLELESISDASVSGGGDLEYVVVGTIGFVDFDNNKQHGGGNVVVSAPDGNPVKVRTRNLPNGLVRAEFTPDKVGIYNLEMMVGNNKELMMMRTVKVFDPMLVRVKDKPNECFVGQEVSFKIDLSRVGVMGIEDCTDVRVSTGLGDVDTTTRRVQHGNLIVCSFTPVVPLTHRVYVVVCGFSGKGCPFDLPVGVDNNNSNGENNITVATGPGLYLARANRSAGFTILTRGSSGRDFDVVVSGPGGVAVPVRCYQQRDGNLRAEFSATSVGSHEVAVYHRSKMVRGSPYICSVYDPGSVRIGGIPTSVVVGQGVNVPVEVGEAGEALLECEVVGPEGLSRSLFCNGRDGSNNNSLRFVPRFPGRYKVMLSYGGESVAGCPIVIVAEEAGAAKAEGGGLSFGSVGRSAVFQIYGPGLPGIPTVVVEGPETSAKCDVKRVAGDRDAGHYVATYVPMEIGVFDVRVTWAGVDIPGSPFHPRVVDGSKLRVIGGWESVVEGQEEDDDMLGEGVISLGVGEERKIVFNCVDAGPGIMEVGFESLVGGREIDLAGDFCKVEGSSNNGRVKVVLVGVRAGEYQMVLKWGHFEVDGGRRRVLVKASESDYDNGPVILSGAGLVSARCGEEAHFTIDASQAGLGPAQVSLHSSDFDIPVTVTPVGGGVYKAVYVARSAGAYQLNVSWGGKVVQGCPLTVNVGAIGDSSKVICTGDGLRSGTVGKDIRSFIDTRRAGPGELTAQCVGPRKTAYCELYDHGDGTFTLNIRPQEPGKHLLSIKYSNEHVVGSPFGLKVVGLPDASRVKVYGPGIEHGVLATFQSRFICDTRGAGAGQLTVRVRGPKGAFRVEMQRESQKDRTILCKFDPTEPGDYRVEVRWAGEHVPGSPFSVMIFDTQEELHAFLQQGTSPGVSGGGGGGGPPTQSEFYGSTNFSMGQMSWRGSQAQL